MDPQMHQRPLHTFPGFERQNISVERAHNDLPDTSRTSPLFILLFFPGSTPTIDRKHVMNVSIDVSRAAQLRDIEASFAACNENFSLETLQHPNKPGVTAVESYEILPDSDIWPNQYDLFRFSERPGERAADVSIYLLLFALHLTFRRWMILVSIVPFSDP